MQSRPELPEDVRAELDLEERRQGVISPGPPAAATAEPVPEDVLSEQDLQARVANEDLQQRLTEGRPPAEEEPRA